MSRNRASLLILAAGLTILPAACRTPQEPGFNVASDAWQIQLAQAVWQPSSPSPAIAGDCVLGTHPDGLLLIEFSKGSLPLVTVRCSTIAWQLEIPAEGRSFGRRGSPAPRSAWLILARHLKGLPTPRGWEILQDRPDYLRIRQTRNGEQLELHLDPAYP